MQLHRYLNNLRAKHAAALTVVKNIGSGDGEEDDNVKDMKTTVNAARAIAKVKDLALHREKWAIDHGVLHIEETQQEVEHYDLHYFKSNKNMETYPCAVVKLPRALQPMTKITDKENEEQGGDKPKHDANPTLYEVLYYDRLKQNPLELEWEAINLDSFVLSTPLYVPMWNDELARELDAKENRASRVIQRFTTAFISKRKLELQTMASVIIQYFMRSKVRPIVDKRRAEEFAKQPVAYRIMVLEEKLENLLELKQQAVIVEDFDKAQMYKLDFQKKRYELEQYMNERDDYLKKINNLTDANEKLMIRKREAVGLEDYMFAKQIKLQIRENEIQLQACFNQTQVTQEYIKNMRAKFKQELSVKAQNHDQLERRTKRQIMKKTATRKLVQYNVYVNSDHQSDVGLDLIINELQNLLKELPDDTVSSDIFTAATKKTQEISKDSDQKENSANANEKKSSKKLSNDLNKKTHNEDTKAMSKATENLTHQGEAKPVDAKAENFNATNPEQETLDSAKRSDDSTDTTKGKDEKIRAKLAEWDKQDAELEDMKKKSKKIVEKLKKLEKEIASQPNLTKSKKKSKQKQLKKLKKEQQSLEKELKSAKKSKKERDKERPQLEYPDLFKILIHEKLQKPKMLKKLVEAGITNVEHLLASSGKDLEKKLSAKSKVVKILRKIAKEHAKQSKDSKKKGKKEKNQKKSTKSKKKAVENEESLSKEENSQPPKNAATKLSEDTAQDKALDNIFVLSESMDWTNVSEKYAMLVAFATLERSTENTHFSIALSPSCIDFLAAHDGVARMEVVGGQGPQPMSDKVNSSKFSSTSEADRLEMDSTFVRHDVTHDKASEMKINQGSLDEQKINANEELRRSRHRRRRLKKEKETDLASTLDTTSKETATVIGQFPNTQSAHQDIESKLRELIAVASHIE